MKSGTTPRSAAVFVAGLLAAIFAPAPAAAQLGELVYVSVNTGLQLPLNTTFSQTASYPFRQETATVGGTYTVARGRSIDIGGGLMWSDRLGIGAGYTTSTGDHVAAFAATIPHPTTFNQPGSATFTTPALLGHAETAMHADLVFAAVSGDALDIKVFGGPSRVQVKQTLIEQFTLSESLNLITNAYTLAVTGTQQREVSATGWGFNAGVDASYFFTDFLGVGAIVRYSRASVNAPNVLATALGGSGTASMSAGGITGGAGLRVRF